MCWLGKVFGKSNLEQSSPKIRTSQVIMDDGILTVEYSPGCYLAAISPTNSMEPGIDDGMFVVLDPTAKDLIVGDIVYYKTPHYEALHRVIALGNDNEGWYCITKGDNNKKDDGIRVRSNEIKGVWRATIN